MAIINGAQESFAPVVRGSMDSLVDVMNHVQNQNHDLLTPTGNQVLQGRILDGACKYGRFKVSENGIMLVINDSEKTQYTLLDPNGNILQ